MCAWDKTLPAGADKIKDSDNNIRLNNAAIETVLGTNITAGPTTIQGAIQGDTTKGRKFRRVSLVITDGTNAATLKCTVASRWNGDTIAETNNIAKNATTGNFSLTTDGSSLTIKASGLTGNVLMCSVHVYYNASGTVLMFEDSALNNDIYLRGRNPMTAGLLDLTTLVDTGEIDLNIVYITDA